jgi:hypothetical protein
VSVLGRLSLPFGNEKLIMRILGIALRNLDSETGQVGAPATLQLERFDPENVRERKIERVVGSQGGRGGYESGEVLCTRVAVGSLGCGSAKGADHRVR